MVRVSEDEHIGKLSVSIYGFELFGRIVNVSRQPIVNRVRPRSPHKCHWWGFVHQFVQPIIVLNVFSLTEQYKLVIFECTEVRRFALPHFVFAESLST